MATAAGVRAKENIWRGKPLNVNIHIRKSKPAEARRAEFRGSQVDGMDFSCRFLWRSEARGKSAGMVVFFYILKCTQRGRSPIAAATLIK
jgi:hypothetical protein